MARYYFLYSVTLYDTDNEICRVLTGFKTKETSVVVARAAPILFVGYRAELSRYTVGNIDKRELVESFPACHHRVHKVTHRELPQALLGIYEQKSPEHCVERSISSGK